MSEENELPQGWRWATIEDIAQVQGGIQKQPKRAPKQNAFPYLRVANVLRGRLDLSEIELMELFGNELETLRLQPGDMLIVEGNGSITEIGRSALWKGQIQDCVHQNHIIRVRLLAGCPEYVDYFWNSPIGTRQVMSVASSTSGLYTLSIRKIAGLRLPFAPEAEQRRIVEAVEAHVTRLDAGVAALKRTQAALKRYRAAVLKAAVEGKLTEAWRAAHPDVEPASKLLERILAERRARWEADLRARGKDPAKAKYDEPTEPDTTNLPALPDGWCWAGFAQVAAFQNGRAFPSNEYTDAGQKLLRPGNLHVDGSLRWTLENTRYLPKEWATRNSDLIVRGHELVMNLTAQSLKDEFLGRVCLTGPEEECLLNQRLARITSMSGLDKRYLLHALKSAIFRRFVDGLNKGSLIQHMFTSQLAEFVLPFPPVAEQVQIVAEVERRLSVVSELEAAVEANLKRAERLRQSILERAFSGRLVPQDPSDEAASALLERIRAERLGKHTSQNGRRRQTTPRSDRDVVLTKKSGGLRQDTLL